MRQKELDYARDRKELPTFLPDRKDFDFNEPRAVLLVQFCQRFGCVYDYETYAVFDKFDKYGDISNWDVSNVMDMKEMFHDARSFNQPLNKWNVCKVTNMAWMFAEATSFNQPLNNWNVSNVLDMSHRDGKDERRRTAF